MYRLLEFKTVRRMMCRGCVCWRYPLPCSARTYSSLLSTSLMLSPGVQSGGWTELSLSVILGLPFCLPCKQHLHVLLTCPSLSSKVEYWPASVVLSLETLHGWNIWAWQVPYLHQLPWPRHWRWLVGDHWPLLRGCFPHWRWQGSSWISCTRFHHLAS